MQKLYSVLLAAALAGCASTSISQGGKAEVVYAGNETIRIRWDPQRTSERSMRSMAKAFCGGREVDTLDAATEAGATGRLQARTWRCEPFSGSGTGM